MATYVPDLYKRLGTTVSIDLGQLGDLGTIRDGVNALLTTSGSLPGQISALQGAIGSQIGSAQTSTIGQVNAQVSATGDQVVQLLSSQAAQLSDHIVAVETTASTSLLEIQHERRLQTKRHDEIMDKLNALAESGSQAPEPALNARSGVAVYALNACQALVLSRAGAAALAEAREKAAELLQGHDEWLKRLFEATERRLTAWDERSEHYWALQRLIVDVAEAWAQVSAPPTPQPQPPAGTTGTTPVATAAKTTATA